MTSNIVTTKKNLPATLGDLGHVANEIASKHVFDTYLERKAENTIKRQTRDLGLFCEYLSAVGVDLDCYELQRDPDCWHGVTWGIVAGFAEWQLKQGFAVSSVNVRLSTIKTYASLAHKAGIIDTTEAMLIKAVTGYGRKEGKRIDEKRDVSRVGDKKAEPVSLTAEQARQLKEQPSDMPQGKRDAVIMCLLLEHGLRVGELVDLQIEHFDLKAGLMVFYREKVDKTQKHKLTADTLRAVQNYLAELPTDKGKLLYGSRKGGKLTTAGMNRIAITNRVKALGEEIGVIGLSAHDCRHYWATAALANGTQIDRLQDAGGWSSPAMPLRYAEAAKIANEGIKLS